MAFVSQEEVFIFGEQVNSFAVKKAKMSFTEDKQLIGFWGTSRLRIDSIGVLVY